MDEQSQQLAADDIEVSGLGPRLSLRARVRRLAISVAAVLVLGLVISGSPALRQEAVSLVIGPTPTPSLPALPGASNLYVLSPAPWVTILMDGRPLDLGPPTGGQPASLHLVRGLHRFEWRGTPFLPQHCTLPVPIPYLYMRGDAEACLLHAYAGGQPGYVLAPRESLRTLPPEQQVALKAAIEAALSAASAQVVIQRGEPYLAPAHDWLQFRIAFAGAPLRATFRLTLAMAAEWWEPCAASESTQPCRFPDQDCRQLCTATQPALLAGVGVNGVSGLDGGTWTVAVPVQASWQLTTLRGVVIDQRMEGIGENALLALLRITWDGAHWHVALLFGHAAGGTIADDTVCAPARDWLWLGNASGPLPGPLVPAGAPLTGTGYQIDYISGPDPTDGCFVSVNPSSFAFGPVSHITQPATFLLRFGVLVAVNAAARQIAQQLPVANAHEQAIASRLQAQATGGG